MKKRKAAGPESILAENLIAGGDAVDLWLNEVLNAMVEMEKIPDVLKCGIEILVEQGCDTHISDSQSASSIVAIQCTGRGQQFRSA